MRTQTPLPGYSDWRISYPLAWGFGVRYDVAAGVSSNDGRAGFRMERKRGQIRVRYSAALCAVLVTAVVAGGCGRHAAAGTGRVDPSPTMPASGPAVPVLAASTAASTQPTAFVSTAKGVRLEYPAGWKPVPSSDYILLLVPVGGSSSGDRSISLDVPDLPLHVPGMIPIGSVVDGYLDDLKKQHAGLHIEPPTSYTVPAAKARRVRSTWTANGRSFVEQAQIMVHGDRVYILRADDDAGSLPETFHAFSQIADSLHFTK